MSNNPATGSLIPDFDAIKVPETPKSQPTNNNGGDSDKKKNPPAKFWVNVGLQRGDKFLSLPMGIALDNLESKPIPPMGNTANLSEEAIQKKQEFRAMRIAERDLWNLVKAKMAQLKPGEEQKLNLEVHIRKVLDKEPTEHEVETNQFALGSDFSL